MSGVGKHANEEVVREYIRNQAKDVIPSAIGKIAGHSAFEIDLQKGSLSNGHFE